MLQQDLAQILPAEKIKCKLIDIMAFAGDAGFYHLIPKAVVQPSTVAEIKAIFKFSQEKNIPLCFRAGGTSLSGQSITDGILVDLGRHWRGINPLQNGELVEVQPGIIAGMVNTYLKPYNRKIGPDPSSINAAMMGGILSNNASGMCCGVAYNSYHTLKTIHFVLPNGNDYNTALQIDYEKFLVAEKEIATKLTELRNSILGNITLHERIRHKYKTKNTVGYSLNAFIDYEHPLDIMAHLLVGAEGTLAFIASAVLQTLPNLSATATALLYFPNIYAACEAIIPLKESGADVLELMDRASLRSVEHLKGLPDFFIHLPDEAACLLCEYQAENEIQLDAIMQKAGQYILSLQLLYQADFTRDHYKRDFYWKIRKGLFPSVGAVRAKGTTVLLEDIAFPVEKLADAVVDLQQLFKTFGYHNAIILGHAKDGNLHFVITQLLDEKKEIERYDNFIRALVDLILKKYDGALKAEHGTGRNMAPFVEAEWGGDAYAIMKELKETIDPYNLLNPGVIINNDSEAHIKDLKKMPVVEEEVDKCIECGFCEHHCPSKDITLTPRQRIQVRRELQRLAKSGQKEIYNNLLKEYQYAGLDTCATDGLCQSDCPVSINTGDLVKRLRKEQHGSFSKKIANSIAKNFATTVWLIKALIATGIFANKIFGKNFMANFTKVIKKIIPAMPLWWNEIAQPPKSIYSVPNNPQVVYFSSCLHRMMGHKEKNLQEAFLSVCKKAGIEVFLPKNISGYCCGQAFSSKGYLKAANTMNEKTIDALLEWSNNGQIPIVCDFTSCTYTFLKNESYLSPEYQKKWQQLKMIDCIDYIQNNILPNLTITQPKEKIVLHPACAAIKLELVNHLKNIAATCSSSVQVPKNAGCCGMAGDRGFLFPELTAAATHMEIAELQPANGYYSTAITCEMSLSHFSQKPYEHIIHLVDEVSS